MQTKIMKGHRALGVSLTLRRFTAPPSSVPIRVRSQGSYSPTFKESLPNPRHSQCSSGRVHRIRWDANCAPGSYCAPEVIRNRRSARSSQRQSIDPVGSRPLLGRRPPSHCRSRFNRDSPHQTPYPIKGIHRLMESLLLLIGTLYGQRHGHAMKT